uniref:ionotropic receptor 143 precursor n=1 Tax=Aedes aegypti TaxID=7159 RepID=UPI000C20FEC4|nr:ionotropic receptor 143 precursor [Aedes aegypti]
MKAYIYLPVLIAPFFHLTSAASSRWIQDLPYYTASVIEYYAQRKVGRFECLFYDLSVGTDNGGFEKLVTQPKLNNIVKYIMNETVVASYDNFPIKPSIAVVYTGDRDLRPPRCPVLVRHFFALLDGHTKVIVLVNMEIWNAYQSIAFMLTNLRFDKVIYIATTVNLFIQMGFNGKPDNILEGIPHPRDLIRSNMRNSYGRPIGFTYRFAPWYEAQVWVMETARYLNTSLMFYPGICKEIMPVNDCMDRLFKANHVDIALDQQAPQEIIAYLYRMIIGCHLNGQVILVPQGRIFNAIEFFTKPFAWTSWIALFLILVSIEVISLVIPTLFKNDPILLSLCGIEKHDLHLASTREKATLLPLVLFFFLMCNAYETKIISYMTNKPSVGNIDTLEELAKSGLKIAANINGDERLVNDSLLGRQVIQTPDNEDYNRLDERYAHLSNNLEAPWLVSLMRNYDFVLGRPKFSIINEPRSTSIYTYWIGVISPFAETLYYTQKVFFEAGLLDKWRWEDNYRRMAYDRLEFRWMNKEPSGMLKFGDLLPTWFVFAAGLVFSFVVFVVETLMHFFGITNKIIYL